MNRKQWLGLGGAVTLCAAFSTWLLIDAWQTREEANRKREEKKQETERAIKNAEALSSAMAAEREAQIVRINTRTFRVTRLQLLDGQCEGRGLPSMAYTIEGGRYEDNVIVATASKCKPFGPADNNVTNMFCCGVILPPEIRPSAE